MISKALDYIRGVISGEIVACKWIKLVCQRHFRDLDLSAGDFPFFFDETRALKAISIFERQRLALGLHAEEPFILMPWQAAIVYLLYGWREKETGYRRFKKVYIKVARGNAKTEFLAGIGNISFLFEGINDPQVFWAATKRDQARIGFERQRRMMQLLLKDYPMLKQRVGFSASRIYEREGLGFVMPLGKDSKTEDGFSPYCALIDEYHAHPNADMVNVLESGMVKHACPLICIITTAGTNPASPCARFEDTCKKVLEGYVAHPTLLPFIYDLDEGDDWKDKGVWVKANPSLGRTVTVESLTNEFEKALAEGVIKQHDFMRKNLNMWTSSNVAWLSDDDFSACSEPFAEKDLEGRLCFGGLDLSRSRDITALVLFFPGEEGETAKVICRFWCPHENAVYRQQNDGIPYLEWAREGWLTLTDGDIIDTDFIYGEIMRLRNRFKIHSIAFDRWRALPLVKRISEEVGPVGYTQTREFMEPFTQNTAHFHVPMTELEKMVISKTLSHGGNPVLRWMNRNVKLFCDGNGNMKIDRAKSSDKVDGMVALCMAMGQFLTYSEGLSEYYSPDVDIYTV